MGRPVDHQAVAPVRVGSDVRDARSLRSRAILSGWAPEGELAWTEDARDPLEAVLRVCERHGRLADAEAHLGMCARTRRSARA